MLFSSDATFRTIAQIDNQSYTFPQTNKTVRSQFLKYWNTYGGLVQYGYPISNEMQEVSATDGKSYTVQYFERAVFELHPEFAGTSSEVLLSLLGSLIYNQKYPTGAPSQQRNYSSDTRLFPETGMHVGGTFLHYWYNHGALSRYGFPISEEFVEISPLDGKPYIVQYFERAVFELHPELLDTPNEVTLSQLGTFRYTDTYLQSIPTVTPQSTVAYMPQPTATPDCSGIPPNANMVVTPSCGPRGVIFRFEGWGFTPGERVGVFYIGPDGSISDYPYVEQANSQGRIDDVEIETHSSFILGIQALLMLGTKSDVRAIGYFKVTP